MATGDLFIGVLLFLLSRKASGSTPAKQAKAADALTKVAGLQARANQAQAKEWIDDLDGVDGISLDQARALSRWIGIESSGYGAGDTRATSSLGERGLLQITADTAKEALTPAEWQALSDPATSREEQARIAAKQFRWHVTKAKKWVNPWPGDDTFDSLFYAKLHHAGPKMLADAKVGGPASAASRTLAAKWKNNPKNLLHLAAANVVAWGSAEAP